MAIGFGVACPKPRPRLLERRDRDRAEDDYAAVQRRLARQRDGYRCRCCKVGVLVYHVDPRRRGDCHHIEPRRRKNGSRNNSKRNLLLLCRVCHCAVEQDEIRIIGRNGDERVIFALRDGRRIVSDPPVRMVS